MTPELVLVEDARALQRVVAERMSRSIRAAIQEREWCFVALPAGHFVHGIYEELVHASLDWGQVEFYFSEERGVPEDHPASAYAAATGRLLENQRIGAHQFHRIEAASPDHEEAAARYAEELPEAFDLMLFEPGKDGHLGAIFPDSPAFAEREHPVVPLEVAQKPRRRIALAPSVIQAALEVIVVATGRERANVVARVLEGDDPPEVLPAALVRERVWVLDRPAAAGLRDVAR